MQQHQPAAPLNSADEFINIPMTPVQSGQVGAIGYDITTKTLAVTFARGSGAVYHYPDVSPEAHVAFVGAESIGSYFGKHIKTLPFKKFENLGLDTKPAEAAV